MKYYIGAFVFVIMLAISTSVNVFAQSAQSGVPNSQADYSDSHVNYNYLGLLGLLGLYGLHKKRDKNKVKV